MTVVDAPPALEGGLAGQKLPAYALPVLAVAVLGVTALLFLFTGFGGAAGFVVVAAPLHVLAQTALSFRVEGRRQAVDRLFTTLVYVAFLLAALPLLLITVYTVQRGLSVLSADFFLTSMFRINPEG